MRKSTETLVFRVAVAVGLLHALDDAFLNRQPGVGLGQHAVAAAIALAGGVAAIVAFPRLRVGLRAAIALVLGIFALVNGGLHVVHVTGDGAADSDLTGIAAAVAGAVLILLAIAIPFSHRGEPALGRRRRWANRAVAVLALAVLGYVFVFPTAVAIVQTHKYREAIPAPPSRAYAPVSFESSDGLRLTGWYVRSRNRAAVVIVHGGGGDRTGGLDQAALLARRGYGVLVYDSRGRGASEGSPNAFGWGWDRDVEGALDFLKRQPDVDGRRIGGIGLSTGADVLISVAPRLRGLRAVVAEGSTAMSFDDAVNLNGVDESAPFFWTMLTAARVFSGSSPPEPLEDLAPRVAPTPLLLIAGERGVSDEVEFTRLYAKAAREPKELWIVPKGRHTAAVRDQPQEYERRVVGLLDRALARR